MSEQEAASQEGSAGATSGLWGIWGQVKAKTAEMETALGSYLAETPDNVQIKSKLAEWGETAGKYLDAADERIGEMESSAGKYLKTLGTDFKIYVEKQGSPAPPSEASELFNADMPTNRLEQQLHKIHTSPELFKGDISDKQPSIDTEQLSTKYPELKALHDKLVPETLTSNQFWNKYESLSKPVLEQDEKRKKILAQEQDDDDEGWGSSDEN